MFSLSITVSVPDLDRHEIELDCPYCELETPVTLGEIRLGGVVICRGCHANMHLEDHLAEYHRAKRNFEATMMAFGRI